MTTTTEPPLGPWEPLSLSELVGLFERAPFRWWLAGGHALEAHLGRSWRTHADIDVGVSRHQVSALVEHLEGWDVHVALDGVLTPLPAALDRDVQRTGNLWCRRRPDGPWALDVLVGEGTESEWIFKRDTAVRRPWQETILHTDKALPYLAPEIQLLFKSKNPRPKDHHDASVIVPELDARQRSWLDRHLPPQHQWRSLES